MPLDHLFALPILCYYGSAGHDLELYSSGNLYDSCVLLAALIYGLSGARFEVRLLLGTPRIKCVSPYKL